jgi:hypothetical protein
VDGEVVNTANNSTWGNISYWAVSGNTVYGEARIQAPRIVSGDRSSCWNYNSRGILLFDTSSINDDEIISNAVISIRGYLKSDTLSISPSLCCVSSNPASNTALAGNDYVTLGTTAYSDELAYANFSASAYNDIALNSSGKSAISKTGITKFGLKNYNYDLSQSNPSWSGNYVESRLIYDSADQGTGYKPKLVVTYSTAVTGHPFFYLRSQ